VKPKAQAVEPTPWRWLFGLTLAGLAIRLVYVLALHPVSDYLFSDMMGAWQLAQARANPAHVLVPWDVVKPQGLPILGGLLVAWFGGSALPIWGVLQALLSTATVPLLWLGARRFMGPRAALVAAGLLAFDYLAVALAGFLMSETYLMFFFALAFACLDPERPLLCLVAGLALGLGALFKAQALPLAALWIILVACWDLPAALRRQAPRPKLRSRPLIAAALMAVGVLAIQIPQSLSIARVVGKGTALPPYGGQEFYLGHCHIREMTMEGPDGLVMISGNSKSVELEEGWPDITYKVSVLDEGFFVRAGLKCFLQSLPHAVGWILRQPFDVLAGLPGAVVMPWPIWLEHPIVGGIFNCVLGYGLVPLALWALWRRRRELGPWLAVGAPLAAVWAVALVFMGNPRFREPFDLFIFSGAAVGLLELWDRFTSKQRA
jgi:hypothetical protein